ncbi:hypothetical protein DVH24_015529 [Malus domestica]|uniref:Uncharacterized protein n=1 Tax=Malus domestica TaxID=3750 RepID=A0A498HNC5_MALDO|nr:hypothetical protein DVH24_015529 [Malus domestica]
MISSHVMGLAEWFMNCGRLLGFLGELKVRAHDFGFRKEKLWVVCPNSLHGALSLCSVILKRKHEAAAMER